MGGHKDIPVPLPSTSELLLFYVFPYEVVLMFFVLLGLFDLAEVFLHPTRLPQKNLGK